VVALAWVARSHRTIEPDTPFCQLRRERRGRETKKVLSTNRRTPDPLPNVRRSFFSGGEMGLFPVSKSLSAEGPAVHRTGSNLALSPSNPRKTNNDSQAGSLSAAVSQAMSDSTDAALAAEGDYQAFERLYRRYLSRIYSLCARLSGSRDRAGELTEAVFVRAWGEFPKFRGEIAFASWLHRLAADVVLNGEEVDGSGATTGQVASASAKRDDVASTSHEGERLDLGEAMDRLPADARRIFVLHDVERFNHEEIAEILSITVGGSKARLRRARVLLMETMGR
jgi:RNA polymerase sigma factor (sigma-70 family)